MSKSKARRLAKKNRKLYGSGTSVPHKKEWLEKQNLQLLKADLIAEKILTISPEFLSYQKQKHSRKIQLDELQNAINLMDGELIELAKVYCKSSGKYLFSYSNEMIQETIKVFGIEKTKSILKMRRKNETHYHPIAVLSDSNSLADLSKNDPISYWLLAANKFFESSFDDILTAREFIETIELKDIIYCNEILRRYLGLSAAYNSRLSKNYMTVNSFGKAKQATIFNSLVDPVANDVQFLEFILQLKTELQVMIRSYCKKKRAGIISQQSIYLVDLATIKNTLCGSSAYFNQKKLKNASKEESIYYDMLEIFDEDCELENDLLKADMRYIHRPMNPTIPLHLQVKRQQQEKCAESFDIDRFETVMKLTESIDLNNSTQEPTQESTKPTAKSNPFAGVFK